MTDHCPHVWRVNGWTLDPATGRWVDPDPACRKPSPFTKPPKIRRRVLR